MDSFDKHFLVLAFLVIGAIGIVWLNLSNINFEKQSTKILHIPDNQIKFNAFLKKFNKSYSGDEYLKRFGHFEKSLEEISLLNADEETGAKHGLTKFSDLSQEEFSVMMHNPAYEGSRCFDYSSRECKKSPYHIFLFRSSSRYFDGLFYHYDDDVKNAFDWRTRNIVGPVLDQKKCLACWAFGIVGLMESMEAKQPMRSYTERSIQELIDCMRGCNGCNGGNVAVALRSMCKGLEIIKEYEYPLKLIKEPCKCSTIRNFVYDGLRLSRYYIRCDMNETDLIRTIYQYGPVIAVVNAKPWQYYTSGVIHRACHRNKNGNSVDHVVQIVGYNRDADVPYFIIKNSWGEDFGENGYVRVAIHGNVCGVTDEIVYLEVQ